jgi:phenylpropionate dioxygenase-like ring-hydroxylating dioxygenase large terminal subunit
MRDEALELINRSMDEQIARKDYPGDFPVLPDLPVSRYSDRDFAAAELCHLWKKTWLLAGLESDLPEVGSYFLFEHLGQSVIVNRGKDGATRAFHNSCRHRASALLQEPQGKVTRFICPYHAWTYALDGQLTSLPNAHDFACLNKSERGLVSVRCESWRGLIFINMDPGAGRLADFMQSAVAPTEGFPLATLVAKDRFVFKMDCNWKLAFHNFLESYHVRTVHPKSLTPYLDLPSWVLTLLDNGHSSFASRKQKGASIYQSDAPAPAGGVGKLFKELLVALSTFPNTFIALDPSGFALQTFWPAGVDKSIMEVRLVGWESSPGDSEYWSVLRDRLVSILTEDKHLFGSLQRSVEAGFLSAITVGYQERAIYWFEEEIDRRIGVENIPEGMRVTQLLAGNVAPVGRTPGSKFRP